MQQLVFEFDEIMVQKSIESPNLDTTVGNPNIQFR
jgi:hypothetical protein